MSDVSLSIAKGELIFLTGPSGAGKSTLLKMIAAIERPSSGSITLNGQDIGKLKASGLPYLRRNLGLILQQQRLLDDRNVLANVMLPLVVSGATRSDAEKRARAALDKVGLLDKAQAEPLSLSGGEQQRVAIARAIVNRPQVILADEPTANLDRANADKVLDALKAFHGAGVTCIISTHDEQETAGRDHQPGSRSRNRDRRRAARNCGRNGMITWLRQHGFALGRALRHLFKPRSGFLLNTIVVAIALALPFAGLTLLENVRPLSEQLAVEPEISIFMSLDTPRDQPPHWPRRYPQAGRRSR